MRTITEIHESAMALVDTAIIARQCGRGGEARSAFELAFRAETEAARMVPDGPDAEPSRSVLYRSAAAMALDAQLPREAERLIGLALSGDPPAAIAEELRDLYERVSFERHLSLRGIALEPNEIQMSLSGREIGFGLARGADFTQRVDFAQKLARRTYERKAGRPFQISGRPAGTATDDTDLFLSVPRAASFAVTLRFGRPKEQLSFDFGTAQPSIVDELMACLELASKGRNTELRERIGDEKYYRNCLGLMRQIAPDGRRVQMVGFTATGPAGTTTIPFTKTPEELPLPLPASPSRSENRIVTVTGQLHFADAEKSTIKLINGTRSTRIQVPDELDEIVHTMWGERVVVTGTPGDGRSIALISIQREPTGDHLRLQEEVIGQCA